MSWLEVAQELPLGGKIDIPCPENCGSGNKLSVHHTSKDYWCNCYRCGFTDRHLKGQQSLAELARIRELNAQAEKLELQLGLPNDFTTEIPLEGRMWLYKAGITETTWRQYGIGYSKYLERVVLPVYGEAGNLIWYQCRAVHKGQKPKYIQPSRGRDKVVFQITKDKDNNRAVVVVEDILSAIRVGKHINCVSLLGTKISTAQASLLGKYDLVITWLDPDRAGRQGAYKIRRTIGLLTEVANIVTNKDPKELSDNQIDKQIKEVLENILCLTNHTQQMEKH